MTLLLDTHAFIWFSENDARLSHLAKEAIESPAHTRFVSMATFWEMAIKISIGRLPLLKDLKEIIAEVQANGFDLLPILPTHILKVENLPYFHRDPFDRMLIAQALVEDFTLISNENLFDQYNVQRIW